MLWVNPVEIRMSENEVWGSLGPLWAAVLMLLNPWQDPDFSKVWTDRRLNVQLLQRNAKMGGGHYTDFGGL